MSGEAASGDPRATPPSAAGFLEPYGARVTLQPGDHDLDAELFLKMLLEQIASSCLEGASVIGHLKCLLRAGGRRLRCNLTSVRLGATCRGEGEAPLSLGSGAELDLAVLVYGLPAVTIDGLVGEALRGLLSPMGVSWSKSASSHANHEDG
jgi:hypothetical protein